MSLLEHEVAGGGPELLLLHAGIADMRMWDPQWHALAERFRVLRCDLRGFGGSAPPTEPYSHVDDLVALLRHVDFAAPAVIGASFGGKVAIDLATAYPDLVPALVLAAPALADHEWSAETERLAAEEEKALERGDVDAALEAGLRMWLADGSLREVVAPMMRRALELELSAEAEEIEPAAPELADLRARTLVLTGDRDLPDFRAIAERIAAEAADTRAEELAGAGHLLTLEQPEEFLRRALEFLA